MRVLIIGCGYVGLPLGVELVRRGHTVFGLRRSATPIPPAAGIQPLTADISRAESLAGLPRDFDWVVNCAASGGGGEDEYRRLYVGGNRNILSWLGGSRPRKFIYTSSTSVYGQTDGSVVTEDSPTHPGAITAAVLLEAEELLRDASKSGFPAVVLRVAGIYGPGRGHAFQQFLRGEARIEGDGSRFINMVHRDDVVGAIIAALERGGPGKTYNVVDDEPVSQMDFFTWLAAQMNRPLPPEGPADDGLGRKRGLTNKRISNARLRTRLAYQFNYPNFRAGYSLLLPSQPDGPP